MNNLLRTKHRWAVSLPVSVQSRSSLIRVLSDAHLFLNVRAHLLPLPRAFGATEPDSHTRDKASMKIVFSSVCGLYAWEWHGTVFHEPLFPQTYQMSSFMSLCFLQRFKGTGLAYIHVHLQSSSYDVHLDCFDKIGPMFGEAQNLKSVWRTKYVVVGLSSKHG